MIEIEHEFKKALDYQIKNKLKEAEEIYKKILSKDKNHLDSLINLGSIKNRNKEYQYAKNLLIYSIKINPSVSEAYINLGNVYQNLNNHTNAIKEYKKSIVLKPNIAVTYYNLANSYSKKNQIDLAISNYKKAIDLDSNFFLAYNNLGTTFRISGKYEEAILNFSNCIKINPNYLLAHYNIMEIQEKLGKVDQLKMSIKKISSYFQMHPIITIFQVLILIRKNKYIDAQKEIEQIDITKFTLTNEQFSRFYELKKIIYDKNNFFEKSFRAAEIFNSIDLKTFNNQNIDKNSYLNYIESGKKLKFHEADIQGKYNIVFLIGFPRSGTTLLDSILRSSKITKVIEEKPFIQEIKEQFLRSKKSNDEKINEARSLYIQKTKINNTELSKNLIIDKYPLNTIQVNFINTIFPEAKYIFALRHPCDVVLSCYMTRFKENSAMANFLNINDSISLYDKTMDFWKNYLNNNLIKYHYTKYENIINNFDHTVKKLLLFLNIEWNETFKNFHQTAIKREKINTPSYNQVIKPIYTDSLNRWKNYKKLDDNIVLNKWVNFFDY